MLVNGTPTLLLLRDRRIVLSFAVAAAVAVASLELNRLLTSDGDGGQFMYAPNSESSPFSSWASGDTVRGAAI